VIGTGSTKNYEMLYELGADELIDYIEQRFEDVTRNIHVVLDTIGGETQERSWQVLKKGGILASLVQPPSDEKAKAFGVRGVMVENRPDGAALAEIAKIVDSGQLAPVIDRILPLSEARRAHELWALVLALFGTNTDAPNGRRSRLPSRSLGEGWTVVKTIWRSASAHQQSTTETAR
jgi:NADPH:quinone reductase-like Zn-dependent oxidoreductase